MSTETDRANGVDMEALHEIMPSGHASDSITDAFVQLEDDILYRDEHPASAAEDVAVIDAAIKAFHSLRDAAVQEHRRRTDAAMARSKELEGGQE